MDVVGTAALFSAMAVATAEAPPSVLAFAESHGLKIYHSAAIDLNGDGRPEWLLYVEDPDLCGSGGCDLYILEPTPAGARQLCVVTITRPPIRVLPTSTRGWRDLSVRVAGGGVASSYDARLRFDGRAYPSNPSVPPATPLPRAAGRIVIAPD